MKSLDWSKYPNFTKEEFDCKETGKNRMRPEFMDILQQIRTTYNKPMIITSGYRDKTHSIERKKKQPGEHTYGLAADILINGTNAMDLFVIAYGYGVRRMGVSQSGDFSKRFLHIGYGDKNFNFPQAFWSY